MLDFSPFFHLFYDAFVEVGLALRILERLDPDAIHNLRDQLKKHPSPEIRTWMKERAMQAGQDVFISEPGGYELVRNPGGAFQMGSPAQEAGRYNSEVPLHEVQVPDFYLGRYPVTNEEYARFLKENPKVEEPRY
ncbi:MAG: SUMF1/EgtB/PvdO family nonheme iron enzyme [Candidatus Brocadia sp.]|nr:SUMF1/EgtB/PvdO family nonheme iron enzyme [Candidatus Brocadia sp.]